MKAVISRVVLACSLLLPVTSLRADSDSEVQANNRPNVQLKLDLQEFQQTKVGELVARFAREKAEEAIGEATNGEGGWKNIVDAAGFDPLEEIESITVVGDDIEDIKEDVLVVVQMKSTTGNLEGLVLGAPNYSSTEYKGQTVHRAVLGEGKQVSATILDKPSKRIILSTNQDRLEAFIDAADDSESSQLASEEGDAFLQVVLNELPEKMLEEGPPANVAKLVQKISFSAREENDGMTLKLSLGMHDEKQAEQVRQMVEGLRAMADLFKNEIEDEHAQHAAELIKTLEIEKNDESVSTSILLPNDLIIGFLREEADLAL